MFKPRNAVYLSVIAVLLFFLGGIQARATTSVSPDSTKRTNEDVAVTVLYSTERGYPGGVGVFLNGTRVGKLQPGSALKLKLIPETQNALLFRSEYFGIKPVTVRLEPQKAGTDLTYSVYVEPFSWKVLRADLIDGQDADKLLRQARFQHPVISMADPSLYPDEIREPYQACAESAHVILCEKKLLDERHVPVDLQALQTH